MFPHGATRGDEIKNGYTTPAFFGVPHTGIKSEIAG